jgi:epoxyqueuosine reductase
MIDRLKAGAEELGLAAVGIAPAIDEVRRAFPWARSVVCAGISYLPPEQPPPDDVPRGLVARIARSADYHTVMREKLVGLADAITEVHPGARAQLCIDTTPIPERKLAVIAGIGWRGKNSNVFIEGFGSWVALGEIVTDAPIRGSFEPLESETFDRCGDCTLCIDSCPTKAILAPHLVDTTKCISALTQSSAPIPLDLRRALANRIYGCDVCQEVCPLNAGIQAVTPEFALDVFPGAYPELIPLIDLSPAEFKRTVAPSSIGWIGRTRIRRNAAIAAANLRCNEAVPALRHMLCDQNGMLRETAQWAIEEIQGAPAKKSRGISWRHP